MSANTNKRIIRKPLNSQVKEILCNLNTYFKDINDKDMSSVTTSAQLVATSTGIALSTVKRVLLEGKRLLEDESKFKSPKKTRCRKNIIIIDDFDKAVIRRTIHNFHITDKEVPTMKRIHEKLKTEINYPGSIWSLRKEVSLLGFKWKRTEDNRKILMEKHEIRYLRINFLIKISEYRIQGRPVVYTDETYIDTTHISSKSYSDGSTSGLKKPISKGNRLIIVHAGGEDGFIPNALLMFKANQKSGDYHNNMNAENYTKWLQTQLIPNLKPNSVVVVDNASYHNSLENPAPNSNSRKQDMIDWLKFRNIDHSTSMLKPQLYQLILQNKQRFIEYKIDTLLREHGHSVLRLPPYHPDFNPIENIWAMIKGYVAKKNVSMNMDTIMRLAKEKVDTISVEVWKNVCDHAIKEETKFRGHDAALDDITERFIINTNDTSDESENDDENDNEIDEDAMSGGEE